MDHKNRKIKWELENNHSYYITEEDFVTQIIILLPQEYDIYTTGYNFR